MAGPDGNKQPRHRMLRTCAGGKRSRDEPRERQGDRKECSGLARLEHQDYGRNDAESPGDPESASQPSRAHRFIIENDERSRTEAACKGPFRLTTAQPVACTVFPENLDD
jgi:hypothetical protein